MKNTFTLLLSLFFLITGNAHANTKGSSEEPNLITNPGFEEGLNYANGWRLTAPYDNIEGMAIVDESFSGTKALRIEVELDDNADEWILKAPVRDVDKLSVTPGDTLEYSVMLSSTSIGLGLKKSFISYDSEGKVIDWNAGAMDISVAYDQYIKYSSRYIVPEGIAFVSPVITGRGACDILVDDFVLTGTFFVSFSTIGPGSVITESGYFDLGSGIKIEAVADAGHQFVAWVGDYVGDDNPDSTTVNGDMQITARFIEEGSELTHTYYMSTTGSDDQDGSIGHPWATITYGSSQLYPGDTLVVKAGIYNNIARETISSSGGNGKYISIIGEEGAILEGSSSNSAYGILTIEDANYVVLEGITVRNAKTHGIKVYGRCKHIILRNCKTEHTKGCGILVQGSYGYPWDRQYYVSDILLEHNEVHWPQEGIWNGDNIYHEDITLMQGVEHFEIRYNYVNAYDSVQYSGGPIAIDVKDGVRYGIIHHNTVEDIPANGIYIDAWDTYAHHIDIYQNYIRNCTGQGIQVGAERGGPIDSVKVYNNIINKIGWVGITSGDYNGGEGPTHPKKHVEIFNNTVINAGLRGWGSGIQTGSSFKEGRIFNNILYDCSPEGMTLNRNDNNFVSNNCIYKLEGSDSGDEGANAVLEDPQFTDLANGDFTLMETSPCIDAGTAEGAPDIDFAGTARPIGDSTDIGAYEVEGIVGIASRAIPDNSLQAYPNPFSDLTTIEYSILTPSIVKISILDLSGKEIEVLVDKPQFKGSNSIDWNGSGFPAGMYLCRMQNGYQSITKKIILKR